MQALILATGETARLPLLTGRVPAAMLPLLDRPVMAYPVELLARAGGRDIAVSLHRQAGHIEAYFGAGSRWGVRLTYMLQRQALGSAGAYRWAAPHLRETTVLLPGDAILDFDLPAALAFHRAHGRLATAIVGKADTLSREASRPVAVGPDGRVAALAAQHDCPAGRVLADTGAYIFEPQVRSLIPPYQPSDCYTDLLPALLATDSLYAYVMEGYWNPLDTLVAYQQAQLDVLAAATVSVVLQHSREGPSTPGMEAGPPARWAERLGQQAPFAAHHLRCRSLHGRQITPGIVVGRRAAIHPEARLMPPVYIGNGCQIERDVELGPGAVIGSNVIVDEGATIRNSCVLDGTYVGRLVKLDGRVVSPRLCADICSGESLPVVDPFLLGEVSPEPMAGFLARVADCAGALLLLLLLSPAIALLAVALLLASLPAGIPGRILERRPRVRWCPTGAHGAVEQETYRILYFRTRSGERLLAPLGAWLERRQLDRLPALWNVLKGDLRLVGVRPLDPGEASQLSEEWQYRCYEGRAGFTGLWYIQSTREADLGNIVVADAFYTATRTPLEDLRLLLRSFLPARPHPAGPRTEDAALPAAGKEASTAQYSLVLPGGRALPDARATISDPVPVSGNGTSGGEGDGPALRERAVSPPTG